MRLFTSPPNSGSEFGEFEPYGGARKLLPLRQVFRYGK
jgi:hypothetical protein